MSGGKDVNGSTDVGESTFVVIVLIGLGTEFKENYLSAAIEKN